jgi:uncharacterized protein
MPPCEPSSPNTEASHHSPNNEQVPGTDSLLDFAGTCLPGKTAVMLFVIHMIDRPDAADLRADVADAHREFVGGHLDAMYLGGPLVADDGTTAIGSMIVMDFPDRAAAVDFIADEPYNRAGLFESVTIRAFHAVVAPS